MAKRRRKQIPQDLQTASITSLSAEGRGITHIDDKICFIDNALAGETVQFKYRKLNRKYNEGFAEEIVEASPLRVAPQCPHYTLCGGCSLQHLQSSEQILHKQQILLEQLQSIGHCKPKNVLEPLVADTFGYRRKARIGVRYVTAKEKVLVGFRERNGRYIADIDSCQVLHPRLSDLIQPLQALITTLSIYQAIPQIEFAMGDEDIALIIRHLADFNEADHAQLNAFAAQWQIALYLQSGGPDSIIKLYPNDENYFLNYALPEFHLNYQFHPTDFTQVNSSINRKMIADAIEFLQVKKTDTVADLFSGLGNFTLAIAQQAKFVIGVEGSAVMTKRASENAERNAITNAAFFTGDLFSDVSDTPWFKKAFNKVLLDPPRSGAKEIIQLLAKKKIERIVYVSCNPATLARDSDILVNQLGYKLRSAGVMDMFPHTSHVESIAVFTRG